MCRDDRPGPGLGGANALPGPALFAEPDDLACLLYSSDPVMSESMTILLGGEASPVGMAVQYINAKSDRVLDELVAWRQHIGQKPETIDAGEFPASLRSLEPLEWNWTRELVMPCGINWTAYLNNRTDGGDTSTGGSFIARQLRVRHVMARNSLREAGHQSTQFVVTPPDGWGNPGSRVLVAYCLDGRWSWEARGEPLSFEHLDRYGARLKRERLDRSLLLEYLKSMGIPVTDDAFGSGVVVRQTDHPSA